MSDISEYLAALPVLRRHARILAGDSDVADGLVTQTIERVLRLLERQDADASRVRRSAKLVLFSLFHDVWREAAPAGALLRPSGADSIAQRLVLALNRLSPIQRHLILLTGVSELSPSDAAEVLAIPVFYVHRTLETARLTLHHLLGARVLLLEDDPITATDLQRLVGDQGHTVIGIASSPSMAMALAKQHSPDLLLADVELQGRDTGVATAKAIQQQWDSAVIFVTGYPERIRPMMANPQAIVLRKPFEPTRLKACIRRVLAPHHAALETLIGVVRPKWSEPPR